MSDISGKAMAAVALLALVYFVVKMLALFAHSKRIEKTLDYDKMQEWEDDDDDD